MEVVIPDWYVDHSGEGTIELELPWITRGAIYRLNELLNGTERVLEFGAGGSTLFFARRCQSVTSFESSPGWFTRVKEELEGKDIHNVTIDGTGGLVDKIEGLKDGHFNCILVDNARGKGIPTRQQILQSSLPKMSRERGILVLDNYSFLRHFWETSKMSMDEFIDHYLDPGWKGEEFRSPRWRGGGTRIFYKV